MHFKEKTSVAIHCLIVSPRLSHDARALQLLADAHALGFSHLTQIESHNLYFLSGQLSETDRERLATELLCDSIAQSYRWRESPHTSEQVVETALRPGVTDTVAEQLVRAAHELGIMGVERAATGQRFVIQSARPLSAAELDALAQRLLANSVIQRYAFGAIDPIFPKPAQSSGQVTWLPIRACEDDALLALSRERRTALDLVEMQRIQSYFREAVREPTDVEIETIAQTWSEHCSHKTFRARIELDGPERAPINDLLKTYLRAATEEIAAPWVRSAFVDNAGIIEFDDEFEVSFKVETHNHPSAIEPFGGANTGVGGVIRDVLGVSAKPIAATDVLCFGPQQTVLAELPAGVLHPHRIRSGVVAGVQDYGNKIGIPMVNGAIWYDPGYTANPLVFCGCIGLAPRGRHVSAPRAGDHIIVLGGRTGRDGLRGATFSSMTMDAETGQVSGASVQIGDPITEMGLIEVITRARDAKLYHAVTDCGAGGLSSAVGELTRHTGVDVDLVRVRLKYAGLEPWEIWLSEAQERMVVAIPGESIAALKSLCDTFDVEFTDIGNVTDTHRLIVRYDRKIVLDLANEFLYEAMPQRHLTAHLPDTPLAPTFRPADLDPAATLLKLLAHPNIASKADVIRIYDHEVQGGTIVKPLVGVHADGPSDACVLKPIGTRGKRGIVLSNGINPEFGKCDPNRMAVSVVDEAIRNAVAVGADPERIALLDNFCWGDPLRPESLGSLAAAARGCYDAARHYHTPFISGKDSLNNEYFGTDGLRHSIPPTLLISAIGIIEDVTCAVTMDFKAADHQIYLLGETRPEFGGSHWAIVNGQSADTGQVPGMPSGAPALYRALHRAMRGGLVCACHDLSEGGLAVALAEMCIGGRLGCSIILDTNDIMTALFSESNGRLLVEVRPEDVPAFESLLRDASTFAGIGLVTPTGELQIHNGSQPILSLALETLVTAWNINE